MAIPPRIVGPGLMPPPPVLRRLTGLELVRQYFPFATPDFAEFLLWEYTAFPFDDEQGLRRSLALLRDDPEQAMAGNPNTL